MSKGQNIEPSELFMNVIAAQQDFILQQLEKSDKRWELECKDIRMNQDHIFDELKNLHVSVKNNQAELIQSTKVAIESVTAKTEAIIKSFPNKHPKDNFDQRSQKNKLLFVGDSLSRNLNISVIKNVTDMNVKRAEAFVIAKDDPKASFPAKNFTDIVPKELSQDCYSTLVLQGGTNEVSNLNISGNVTQKIEILKDEIKKSSENMFELAQRSLSENSSLEKVIILKRIFRCDLPKDDPSHIRSKLSEYGNRVYDDIWLSKGCPGNIIIAQQPLECQGPLAESRYGSPSTKGYDGVHMRGRLAVQHYTGSFVNVLIDTLSNPNSTSKPYININPKPTYADAMKNKKQFPNFQFVQPESVAPFAQFTVPPQSQQPSRKSSDITGAKFPFNMNSKNIFSFHAWGGI